MKPTLSIAFITSRSKPEFEWFLDSLRNQVVGDDAPELIYINREFASPTPVKAKHDRWDKSSITIAQPMPNLWQGSQRVVKDEWWNATAARNTALCLCKTEFIAF